MSSTYKLNKECKICKCKISDKNKSGYCNKHRPRDGKNNPMYGHSIKECMSLEKYEEWKNNISEGSKRNWRSQEYRNKVISSNIGKKRSEEFKQEQSERTKQSYINNPQLRELRGKMFSDCWKDGRNHYHGKSTNRSKEEYELFDSLLNSKLYNSIERKTIFATDGKWYYPDILINERYIIEFYGDYYHANPSIYNDESYIIRKKNLTVKDVHDADKKRQIVLENAGYKFMYVWQSDWKKDKKIVLDNIYKFVTETEKRRK